MALLSRIDHFSVGVTDMPLAEEFYTKVLAGVFGGGLEDRKYCCTEELLLSAQAHDGHFDPLQSRVRVGDMVIALFLHYDHYQEEPPEVLRGTPRVALAATEEQMEQCRRILDDHEVPYEGPVEQPESCPFRRSLYFRDPFGNFLELCVA